jgi:hypothetical protein
LKLICIEVTVPVRISRCCQCSSSAAGFKFGTRLHRALDGAQLRLPVSLRARHRDCHWQAVTARAAARRGSAGASLSASGILLMNLTGSLGLRLPLAVVTTEIQNQPGNSNVTVRTVIQARSGRCHWRPGLVLVVMQRHEWPPLEPGCLRATGI